MAENLRNELKKRYEACLPPLMQSRHRCLDFGILFDNICGNKPQRLKIPENTSVTEFKKIHDGRFDLQEKYILDLDYGSSYQVVFQEENLICLLYTDQIFNSAIGREFTLVFDVFYAKTGTEAVAESFYRVMNMQEQDGDQKFETLALRSILDWCLPAVLQCEQPIKEIAKLYIEGDKKKGLKKHLIPVYQN